MKSKQVLCLQVKILILYNEVLWSSLHLEGLGQSYDFYLLLVSCMSIPELLEPVKMKKEKEKEKNQTFS